MRTYPHNEVVDAVVIGTGAGGAPLLARLAKAGLKIVALEAGKQWNPATDFATDEREQSKLFWNFERLSAGEDPVHFGRNNSGIGVGGSTLHYTAYTPRPLPEGFLLRTNFGVGQDWPISYEDLEPFFDELEQFLGISGPSPYPWGPPRKSKYPLPPLPLNGPAQLMQRGCEKIGIKTSPAANAALSAAYYQEHIGWRHACTNRGFCQAGCSTGAKASMDVTYIPLAVHFGAEIRPECFATVLERNKYGHITAVVYRKNGLEEKQLCRNVFLCAGAIETPRLLLMNGMSNCSGQVGRNFMANTALQVWGEFEEEVRPNKGIPGGLISEDMQQPQDADFASGYLIQSIGVMPVTYASQLTRATGIWGTALRERMRQYNHVAGINIHGECLPNENSFLELSNEADEMGLAKPRVHFTQGENEKRITRHGERVLRQIWKEAGAQNMFSFQRFAHTIGTCRMGRSADAAVVNAQGRSFDVPNLYICDNSVFPSSLAVNPALTIMALSLRTADLFLAKR
jgi:choline dehydrogenase-like flavoprotein